MKLYSENTIEITTDFKKFYSKIKNITEENIQIKDLEYINSFFVKIVRALFEYIKDNQYDVAVLTTRRCFDLVECVYKNNKDDFSDLNEIYVRLISSQAIDICKYDFANKNVLLVDDIMIHGKAVFSIYSRLKDNCKKINTLVFIRNIEFPDFYEIATKQTSDEESLFYFLYLNQEKWKKISNIIVYYFTYYKTPYLSYQYAYNSNDGVDNKIRNMVESNILLEVLNSNEEDIPKFPVDNLKTNTIYSLQIDKKIKDLFEGVYLRQLSFNESNVKLLVPHCLFKPIKKSVMEQVWKNLSNTNGFCNTKLNRIKEPVDIFKVLTAMANYSLILEHKFDIKESLAVNIDKSYYDGFHNDVKNFFKQIKIGEFNVFCDLLVCHGLTTSDDTADISLQNSFLSTTLQKYSNENSDLAQKYNNFISEISLQEDKIFSDNLHKYNGNVSRLLNSVNTSTFKIPLSLLNNFYPSNVDKLNAYIINVCETGVSSLIVADIQVKSNDGVCAESVGFICKTGEQSYRIYYQINKDSYVLASRLYDLFVSRNGYDKLTDEQIKKIEEFLKSQISSYGKKEELIYNTVKILKSYANSELSDLLYNYSVLVTKNDFETISRVLNIADRYFKYN